GSDGTSAPPAETGPLDDARWPGRVLRQRPTSQDSLLAGEKLFQGNVFVRAAKQKGSAPLKSRRSEPYFGPPAARTVAARPWRAADLNYGQTADPECLADGPPSCGGGRYWCHG